MEPLYFRQGEIGFWRPGLDLVGGGSPRFPGGSPIGSPIDFLGKNAK